MGMVAIFDMWPGLFEQAFVPPSNGGSTWNFSSIGLVVTEEKKFKDTESRDLDQGQSMTLTFGTHKASRTHLVDCIYQLSYHSLQ